MSDSITIEAVAVVRDGDDGLYLDWLLEGGICALELAGTVLFASNEANDMCYAEGSCEVFSSDDFDAERLRADTAVAEFAALREELASANADKAAYAQNEIDLRTSLDAVKLNLSRADELISTRTADLLACGTRRKAAEQRNAELEKQVSEFPTAHFEFCDFQGYNPDGSEPFEFTEGPIKKIKAVRMIGWKCVGPKRHESGASE